jgi:ABC-type nitrate/sulfonate/bicarbonate transport system substrate-binding protein
MHCFSGNDSAIRRRATAAIGTIAALGALIATAATGLSPAAASSARTDASAQGITLTVSETADFPLLLKASNLFNNLPFTLQFANISAPTAVTAALTAGQIDVGAAGDSTAAFEVANAPTPLTKSNIPILGIAVAGAPFAPYPAPTIYVTTSSGITSLAGLRGKTIGYNLGGTVQAGYLAALASAGLTAADVKPVQFASSQQAAAAFNAGDLDAVVSQYAYVSNLVVSGQAKPIAGPAKLGVISFGLGWLTTASDLKNPAKVAAIKTFFYRLQKFYTQWYPNHPAQVEQIYETVDDETPQLASIVFADAQHTDFYHIGTPAFLKIEQTTVAQAYKAGLVASDRNIDIGYTPLLDKIVHGAKP